MTKQPRNPAVGETTTRIGGVEITGQATDSYAEILTGPALSFVARLHRAFEPRRQQILARRVTRQSEIDAGNLPDFLDETRDIRESDWTVAPIPEDLADRRVEITGPVDRKMVINALNSGANVFMADFEDANSPTWSNNIEGQLNLRDAVARTIEFVSPEGKQYRLNERPAVLLVRPRGWHLNEKHILVDGVPVGGGLVDFGLYLFHNAEQLMARGSGPYFYLPKLENHLEARLWNDVFELAQDALGLRQGTIRATVLIENILAAFEMHEILWELKDHSAGLNCGRWDYIFSFIKKCHARPDYLLPDRGQVTMERHFLNAYVELLIQTCHRRGIHAMGGMAAQIPIRHDPAANEQAIEKVRQDKLREVNAGHDGTWVAHPGLVSLAKGIFDEFMPAPNQITNKRADVRITAADLLEVPRGTISERGLRHNIDVGLQYLEAWLRGSGCVPIYHLMEDAATAEISRSQVWQWVKHGAKLEDGRVVTPTLVERTIQEELRSIQRQRGPEQFAAGRFALAADLFHQMMTSETFPQWLTTVAYDHID
jgi:malate synthase